MSHEAAAENIVANIDVQAIEDSLQRFEDSCKHLMNALENMAERRPIIQPIVLASRAVISLELKRRSTDRKIAMISLQMSNMLSVLLLLKNTSQAEASSMQGEPYLEGTLNPLIEQVVAHIIDYGNLSDTYSKKSALVRIVQRDVYEDALAEYVAVFSDDRQLLSKGLRMDPPSEDVDQANSSLQKQIMLLLFRRLDTPHEKDVWNLVVQNGGVDSLENNSTLEQLIIFSRNDPRQPASPLQRIDQQILAQTLRDLKEGAKESITRNLLIYSRKLELQKKQPLPAITTYSPPGPVTRAGRLEPLASRGRSPSGSRTDSIRSLELPVRDRVAERAPQLVRSGVRSPSPWDSLRSAPVPVVSPRMRSRSPSFRNPEERRVRARSPSPMYHHVGTRSRSPMYRSRARSPVVIRSDRDRDRSPSPSPVVRRPIPPPKSNSWKQRLPWGRRAAVRPPVTVYQRSSSRLPDRRDFRPRVERERSVSPQSFDSPKIYRRPLSPKPQRPREPESWRPVSPVLEDNQFSWSPARGRSPSRTRQRPILSNKSHSRSPPRRPYRRPPVTMYHPSKMPVQSRPEHRRSSPKRRSPRRRPPRRRSSFEDSPILMMAPPRLPVPVRTRPPHLPRSGRRSWSPRRSRSRSPTRSLRQPRSPPRPRWPPQSRSPSRSRSPRQSRSRSRSIPRRQPKSRSRSRSPPLRRSPARIPRSRSRSPPNFRPQPSSSKPQPRWKTFWKPKISWRSKLFTKPNPDDLRTAPEILPVNENFPSSDNVLPPTPKFEDAVKNDIPTGQGDATGSRVQTAVENAARTVEKVKSINVTSGELGNIEGDLIKAQTIANNAFANINTQGVRDSIGALVESSKVLLHVLDEVSHLHPFIGAAVMAFKLVISLELTRRENDQKVIALTLVMQEMMWALSELRTVNNHNRKDVNLQVRMKELVAKAARDITSCGNACDTYMKKHPLVRVLKGPIYQMRFAEFATSFTDRRREIQLAVSIQTTVGVDAANDVLAEMQNNVRAVDEKLLLLFRSLSLQSPEEQELAKQVKDNGGNECVNDDNILRELVIISMSHGTDNLDAKAKPPNNPDVNAVMLADLRRELSEDVDESLAKNMVEFSEALEKQKKEMVAEVKDIVHVETERVITAITCLTNLFGSQDHVLHSPHKEQIVDPNLYVIWNQMGWKSSVKSLDFVLAIHDYFHDKSFFRNDSSHTLTPKSPGSLRQSNDDQWALQYLSVLNVQPLLDVFDTDGTGFFSIQEVNELATSRPKDWSLPQWLAFWIVEWHTSICDYSQKISSIIDQMHSDLNHVLPANRSVVNAYLGDPDFASVELLLQSVNRYKHKVDPSVERRFMSYVQEEESRIRNNLESVEYEIDDSETFTLVAGQGTIERYIFPLLYLLLKQHRRIVKVACKGIISSDDFSPAVTSLSHVFDRVRQRIEHLSAVYKQKTLEYLGTSSFGMFKLLGTTVLNETANTKLPPGYISNLEEAEEQTQVEADLKYGILDAEYDSSAYLTPEQEPNQPYNQFRYTDKQFTSNPARARWSFACAAVLYQVQRKLWFWTFFKTRFMHRKRYVELIERRHLSGLRYAPYEKLNEAEETELAGLQQSLTNADLRFYGSIAQARVRRICIHFNTSCSSCSRIIAGPRVICLECTTNDHTSHVDLCSSCSPNITIAGRPAHDSNHLLFSVQRFIHERDKAHWLERAKRGAYRCKELFPHLHQPHSSLMQIGGGRRVGPDCIADTESNQNCGSCHQPLSFPFWLCADCDLLACTNCEKKLRSGSTEHDDGHILVRCTPMNTAETEVTVKTRLQELEKRFDERDAMMNQRLATMEELLRLVLARVTA